MERVRNDVSVHSNLGGQTEGTVAAERGLGGDDDVRGRVRRQREQLDQRSRSRRCRHTAVTRCRDYSLAGNSATIWSYANINSLGRTSRGFFIVLSNKR